MSTAMRLFGICLFLAFSLIASVARAKPLLVLHLDFNTIQMRKETVVGCLCGESTAFIFACRSRMRSGTGIPVSSRSLECASMSVRCPN